MRQRSKGSLSKDISGATIVEFAMVAPVLMLTLVAIFDISYNMYIDSVLQGAMQKAGRNSTVEGAEYGDVDVRLEKQVRNLVSNGNISFERKAYSNFSDVNKPEEFVDENGDGICNDGEVFEDTNDNQLYDTDRALQGTGGADDAVIYTVNVEYERIFPLASFIGVEKMRTATATTILRNQPFELRKIQPKPENCL